MKQSARNTVKCFHPDCDAEIVRIERYHARNGLPWDGVAVWELTDGAWKANGEWYDQGTHFHLFCADWRERKGFIAGCSNDYTGECGLPENEEDYDPDVNTCVCPDAGEWVEEAGPGHEFKRWGNELPLELQRVVYSASALIRPKSNSN